MRHYRSMLWALTLASLVAAAQDRGKQYVLSSVHNLSATGPGPIKAVSEPGVCVFCHTPHTASPAVPLWNHASSSVTYNVYSSSTLDASVPAPSTPSKLCLSCHDGTIALGQTVRNGNLGLIDTTGTLLDPDASFASTAAPNLGGAAGGELLNDHPVSFPPQQDGLLVAGVASSPPSPAVPEVALRDGKVECISCHQPHRQDLDPILQKFLVGDAKSGRLCLACHQHSLANNYWNSASHKTSTKVTLTSPPSNWAGYGTVAQDACLACHLPHSSTVSQRLVRASEENTCFLCHGDANRIATYNLQAEFRKVGAVPGATDYAHPTVKVTPSVHDAADLPAPVTGYTRPTSPTMPETSAAQPRHAECADCHNPHAASSLGGSTVPPGIQSPLLNVTGVTATATDGRTPATPAVNQYQICLVCHGDSANKPQATPGLSAYGRTARRVTDSLVADPYNIRLELYSPFARHPVTQPRWRTAGEVPSLRPSMLNLDGSAGRTLGAGTYVYCTDCHANNQARGSRGTGPNGPHASTWAHLLERRYEQEPPPASPGSPAAGVIYQPGLSGTYGLCNKCHDIDNSILRNDSFKEHDKHVRGKDVSCSTCHDPHGIQGGTATNNARLINFDLAIVAPSSSNILRFERTGPFSGRCWLRCHDRDHDPGTY